MATKKRKVEDAGLVPDLRKSLDIVHDYLRHSHGSEHVAKVFQSEGLCFGCHRSTCVCKEDDIDDSDDVRSKAKQVATLTSKLKDRNNLIDDLLEKLRDLNCDEMAEWFKQREYCIECYNKDDDCDCKDGSDAEEAEAEGEKEEAEKDKKEQTTAKTEIKKAENLKIACPDCRKNLIFEDEQTYCDACNAKRSCWKFQCLGCYEKLPKPGSYHSKECEQTDVKFVKSDNGICGMSFCREKGFKRHPESKRILCENCYQGWVLNNASYQKMSQEYQVKF